MSESVVELLPLCGLLRQFPQNSFCFFFLPAIMPKCSKFSNIHDLWPPSNILDLWPLWHKELTEGLSLVEVTSDLVRSQPEHRSNIFGTKKIYMHII